MSGPKQASRIGSEEAASAYLAGLINVEKERNAPYSRFDLEPIRRLMERLGDPQDDLSVIHLAGSKGKGSTGLMAEALLGAAGERVGTFTSPHLERWSERFRIDGREVAGELLADAVERIAPHIDALRKADPGHAPSFFDALTATALLLFSEAKVIVWRVYFSVSISSLTSTSSFGKSSRLGNGPLAFSNPAMICCLRFAQSAFSFTGCSAPFSFRKKSSRW